MKFDNSIPNLGRTSTGAPVVIDESTSNGTAGTVLCSSFLTPIAQELYNAITMSGLIPSEDNTQLYQLLNGLKTGLGTMQSELGQLQQFVDYIKNNLKQYVDTGVNLKLAAIDQAIQTIRSTMVSGTYNMGSSDSQGMGLHTNNSSGRPNYIDSSGKAGDLPWWSDVQQMANVMNSLVGIPLPWPTNNIPTGFLVCNGAVFNPSAYPELYAIYPTGTLPDLRGMFIRGLDSSGNVDNFNGGNRQLLSFEDGSYTSLSANTNYSTLNNAGVGGQPLATLGYDNPSNSQVSANAVWGGGTGQITVTPNNSNGLANYLGVSRPKNIAFHYIVYTGQGLPTPTQNNSTPSTYPVGGVTASNTPAGAIHAWPSNVAPQGWSICNGATFDLNGFPQLAAVLPSGTLPDLRGMFLRGLDTTGTIDNVPGGRQILSFEDGSLVCLGDNVNGNLSTFTGLGGSNNTVLANYGYDLQLSNGVKSPLTAYTRNATDYNGDEPLGVTRPKNIAVNYVIYMGTGSGTAGSYPMTGGQLNGSIFASDPLGDSQVNLRPLNNDNAYLSIQNTATGDSQQVGMLDRNMSHLMISLSANNFASSKIWLFDRNTGMVTTPSGGHIPDFRDGMPVVVRQGKAGVGSQAWISFPTPFTTTPSVQVSQTDGDGSVWSVQWCKPFNIQPTGFNVVIVGTDNDGGHWNQSATILWTAYGA